MNGTLSHCCDALADRIHAFIKAHFGLVSLGFSCFITPVQIKSTCESTVWNVAIGGFDLLWFGGRWTLMEMIQRWTGLGELIFIK